MFVFHGYFKTPVTFYTSMNPATIDSSSLQDAILESNLPDPAKVYLVKNMRQGDKYFHQATILKTFVVALLMKYHPNKDDISLEYVCTRDELEDLQKIGQPNISITDGEGEEGGYRLKLNWTHAARKTPIAEMED